MEQGACFDSVRFNQLVTELGGDEPSAVEVVEIFLSELPQYADALQSATSPGEFAQVLHKFRGALLVLGLSNVATRIAALEQEAKVGRTMNAADVSSVCEVIADIAKQCRNLLPK